MSTKSRAKDIFFALRSYSYSLLMSKLSLLYIAGVCYGYESSESLYFLTIFDLACFYFSISSKNGRTFWFIKSSLSS